VKSSSFPSGTRFRYCAVLLLICLALPGVDGPASTQEPSAAGEPGDATQPDTPRFRLETGYVRVDAYAMQDGAAVRDLTVEDFEVFEDGVLQKVADFEHVQVEGWTPQERRREPQTVAESRAMAEDPRARVFVIFLDTYHTSLFGSHRIRRPLVDFLDRVIGPDDLFAVMTPEMSARDIALARKTTTVEGMLSRHWPWGKRDGLANRDREELLYEACYPPEGRTRTCPDPRAPTGQSMITETTGIGVASEMIQRRREMLSLDALSDLAGHLGGIREERKAVLVVSDGWRLFRPNRNLARIGLCDLPPGVKPMGVGPDGRLTMAPPHELDGLQVKCDRDRQILADLDTWQTFRDLRDHANRANVSFYPVDSRGLPASDMPIESTEFMTTLPSVDQAMLTHRIETLRTLAADTDGLAVVNSNDIERGIRRIVDDLTSYYLLGYYTSNTKLDGKFRSIKVRVKRPGVEVRARRGYLAPTRDEIEEGRRLAAVSAASVPGSAVQTALQALAAMPRQRQMASHVSWLADPDGGRLWFTVELDRRTARSSDWAAGGTAELVIVGGADEETVAIAKAAIEPASPVVALDVSGVALAPGEYVARLRLGPALSGAPLTDVVSFSVSDAGPGQPRLRRRGPTTGTAYALTATPAFQRTERIRVETPLGRMPGEVSAELLDRNGHSLQLPVDAEVVQQDGLAWAAAEVVLAPLAPGDYVIRTSIVMDGHRHEVLTAFRIVP